MNVMLLCQAHTEPGKLFDRLAIAAGYWSGHEAAENLSLYGREYEEAVAVVLGENKKFAGMFKKETVK